MQIYDLNCLVFLGVFLILFRVFRVAAALHADLHSNIQPNANCPCCCNQNLEEFIGHNPVKKVHKFKCKLVASVWDPTTV